MATIATFHAHSEAPFQCYVVNLIMPPCACLRTARFSFLPAASSASSYGTCFPSHFPRGRARQQRCLLLLSALFPEEIKMEMDNAPPNFQCIHAFCGKEINRLVLNVASVEEAFQSRKPYYTIDPRDSPVKLSHFVFTSIAPSIKLSRPP